MCGLVGGTGLSSNKEYEALNILMLNNVLRGDDSTGVFYTYKDNHNKAWYNSKKDVVPSSTYISTDDWKDILRERPITVAGHARAATKGHVTKENAHPFEVEGKIVGMHNGTIHGKFPLSSKFETDSEAMFNLIAEKGLKTALEDIHKDASSVAYVLTMYDVQAGRVNIIRNYARPLFLARHKINRAKMFWASEKSFLLFALLRPGIIAEFEVEELKVNSLVTFNPYCIFAKEDDDPKWKINIEEDWFKVPTKSYEYKNDSGWWKSSNNYYSGPEYKTGRRYEQGSFYDGMPPANTDEHKTKKTNFVTESERLEKAGVPSTFKIGDKYETLDELLHTLECGCQICGNPSTIINSNWKKFKFEYGKSKDFICDACTDKYNDDLLACEYGLVNLVKAKPADKSVG